MSARESATEAARALGDLATRTPVEIDTVLAKLDSEIYQLGAHEDSLVDLLHKLAGHRKDDYGLWRDDEQVMHGQDVIDSAQAGRLLADPARVGEIVDQLIKNGENLAVATEQFNRIDAEYQTRPWSRYVTVPGGHVHSGIWCAGGTIRPRTLRSWTPELSGQSVDQAIAKLQTTMCTHCFRDAPVVDVAAARGLCPGSGQQYDTSKPNRMRFAYGKSGFCRVCHTNQTVSSIGNVKQHKVPSTESPKAKSGQPANADGGPVYVARCAWKTGKITDEGNALKTMVAVSRAAISAARDLHCYGADHPDGPAWVETLNRMVPLLAADKGVTEKEVREDLAKKAKK